MWLSTPPAWSSFLSGWESGVRMIEQHSRMLSYALLLILVFGVIILLHLADTSIWAAFYYWRNLFADFETAFYFSLGSYTTIGYGDVVLPQRWRLLGGIEGVSGVLLCGLSTAFIFRYRQCSFSNPNSKAVK